MEYDGSMFQTGEDKFLDAQQFFPSDLEINALYDYPVEFEYQGQVGEIISLLSTLKGTYLGIKTVIGDVKNSLCDVDPGFELNYWNSNISQYSHLETLNDKQINDINFSLVKIDRTIIDFCEEKIRNGEELDPELKKAYDDAVKRFDEHNELALHTEIVKNGLYGYDSSDSSLSPFLADPASTSDFKKSREYLFNYYDQKDGNLSYEEAVFFDNILASMISELEFKPTSTDDRTRYMEKQAWQKNVSIDQLNLLKSKKTDVEKKLGTYVPTAWENIVAGVGEINSARKAIENAWYSGVKSAIKGEGLGGLWDAAVLTSSTGCTVAGKCYSGVLKIGEYINNAELWALGTVTSGVVSLFDKDLGNDIMEGTMDKIREDGVGKWEKWWYEDTPMGQFVSATSALDYDGKGANLIQDVSEFGGKVIIATGITAVSVGTAAPAVPVLLTGFAYGSGKEAENYAQSVDRENGESYNYTEANLRAFAGGAVGAAEFYGYGQMGAAAFGLNSSPAVSTSFVKNFFTTDLVTDTSAVLVDHAVAVGLGDETLNEALTYGSIETVLSLGLNAFGAGHATKSARVADDALNSVDNIFYRNDIDFNDPVAYNNYLDSLTPEQRTIFMNEYYKNGSKFSTPDFDDYLYHNQRQSQYDELFLNSSDNAVDIPNTNVLDIPSSKTIDDNNYLYNVDNVNNVNKDNFSVNSFRNPDDLDMLDNNDVKIGDINKNIYEIDPELGVYDQLEISEDLRNTFINQKNRFDSLKGSVIDNKGLTFNSNGQVLFEEGTLYHGTKFDYNTIDSISDTGILTGQAYGIPEDCETFYCADFYRITEDISVSEYNSNLDNFFDIQGRTPFGNGRFHGDSIAFVVKPSDEINDLLSYDAYKRGTVNGDITNDFIMDLPVDDMSCSAVLYGVPSEAICGIVVGDDIINDIVKINYLKEKFPGRYIISCDGTIIFNDNMISISNSGILNDEIDMPKVDVIDNISEATPGFVRINSVVEKSDTIGSEDFVRVKRTDGSVFEIYKADELTLNDGRDIYAFKYSTSGNTYTLFSDQNLYSMFTNIDETFSRKLADDFLTDSYVLNCRYGYIGNYNYKTGVKAFGLSSPEIIINESSNEYFQYMFDHADLSIGTVGVDQGASKKLLFMNNEVKENNIKYLKSKGFDEKSAVEFMTYLDSDGACSYAEFGNEIFSSYRYNPQQFEKDFGFPMYIENVDGTRSLNTTQLLCDMYLYINSVENGGKMFKTTDGVIDIVATKRDGLFGTSRMNASKQIPLSTGSAYFSDTTKNVKVMNQYLKSKNPNLDYQSKYIINNHKNYKMKDSKLSILTDDEIFDVKQKVLIDMNKGKQIALSYYDNPKSQNTIRMFDLEHKFMTDTKCWGTETNIPRNNGMGHTVFVLSIDNDGLWVTSWGNPIYIYWDDLRNMPFSVTSSSISGIF